MSYTFALAHCDRWESGDAGPVVRQILMPNVAGLQARIVFTVDSVQVAAQSQRHANSVVRMYFDPITFAA